MQLVVNAFSYEEQIRTPIPVLNPFYTFIAIFLPYIPYLQRCCETVYALIYLFTYLQFHSFTTDCTVLCLYNFPSYIKLILLPIISVLWNFYLSCYVVCYIFNAVFTSINHFPLFFLVQKICLCVFLGGISHIKSATSLPLCLSCLFHLLSMRLLLLHI